MEDAYSNLSCTVVMEEGHQKSKRLSYTAKFKREVIRCAPGAWKAIPESIIVRSFKKCCISNALDRSKDDIVWEDDVDDKDDNDWVESTDNNLVMSDDGKCDE
jgi:hypothetical protein